MGPEWDYSLGLPMNAAEAMEDRGLIQRALRHVPLWVRSGAIDWRTGLYRCKAGVVERIGTTWVVCQRWKPRTGLDESFFQALVTEIFDCRDDACDVNGAEGRLERAES